MKLQVSEAIAKDYSDLRIGILVGEGVDNREIHSDLEALKKTRGDSFRKSFSDEALLQNKYIQAWQAVYKSFGVNPKKKKPTAEALLRRLLKGGELPQISKIVDSYLLVETEFLLPIGGYDTEKISDAIFLRYSPGNETFFPIDSSREELTKAEEVVYADSRRILTRRWNFRDCDYAKITSKTTNFVLFTEAPVKSISTEYLLSSLERIKTYIEKFCGGDLRILLADVSEELGWDLHE